mgnify:FL=1
MAKNSFMNQDTRINNNRGVSTVVNNQGLIVPLTEGTVSADTYMENCFYSKCAYSARKIGIFYEWQNNKKRYVNRTNLIIQDYPHYRSHNEEHSRAIIEAIEMFLGKWRIDRMSIGDMWLFLNAAYGHDIGMVYEHDEAMKLWCDDKEFQKYLDEVARNTEDDMYDMVSYCRQLDNALKNKPKMENIKCEEDKWREITSLTGAWPVEVKKNVLLITSDYIRRHHHERSQSFFHRLSKILGVEIAESRLYMLLGKVVYAHGADMEYIEEELPIETQGFGNEVMHPQFVAMLLRLGDLLDMDNNRFDTLSLEHFGKMPYLSETQLKKHMSLAHLLITDREIQAVENTDQPDVCRAAKKWFHFIEEEVKNITTHWNKIAPENFGGCTFKGCNLRIFLNESESLENDHFQVESKKFMSVLIGDKLYQDPLIFLREYLQNAMDATKIMMWIKNKNQEELTVKEKNDFKNRELTPKSLDSEVLKNYEIEIKLELVEEEDSEKISICILDHGIGMDEECMRALSVIGTGWNGRKKYIDDIAGMPAWMRPAGGFGIGIQSGFMMSDKIEIITRGLRDVRGYEIELFSPRKSGKIDYLCTKREKTGTEVRIDVPLRKMLREVYRLVDMKKLRAKNENKKSFEPDCFKYEEILRNVQAAVAEYVERVIPNSFIPITVTGIAPALKKPEKSRVDSYMNEFITTSDQTVKEDNGIDYMKSRDTRKSFYWVRKEQTFVCLTEHFTDFARWEGQKDKLLFKGTYVQDMEESALSKYITVMVDVMGKRAQDSLYISRSRFQDDYRKKVQKTVIDCLQSYINLLIQRIKQEMQKNQQVEISLDEYCYWFLNTLYFKKDDELNWLKENTLKIRQKGTEFVSCIRRETKYRLKKESVPLENLLKLLAKKKNAIMWKSIGENKIGENKKVYTLLDIRAIQEENDIHGSKRNTRQKAESMISAMLKGDSSQFVIDDEILCTLLEEYAKERDQKVTRIVINGLADFENGCMIAFMEPEQENRTEEKKLNEILREEIKEPKLYVEVGESYREKYDRLFVTATPYDDVAVEENKNIILIPFTKMLYELYSPKSEISKNDLGSWEGFWNDIITRKAWKRAVDWVNNNGKYEAGLFNKEKIQEQYKDFCGEFYEILKTEKQGK